MSDMKAEQARDLGERDRSAWRRSARLIAWGAPLAAALSLACIRWVDLPLARWIHARGLDGHAWMLWPMSAPIAALPLAGLFVFVYALRRLGAAPGSRERAWFVICAGLLACCAAKDMLKRMFGRTWPREVADPGPVSAPGCGVASHGYLNDGISAFHAFGGATKAFQAFPSGTTIIMLALALPLCSLYPRARAPIAAATAFTIACLLLTNTHFLADVVAGGYVGMVGGLIVSRTMEARLHAA
jgi:hypothetical protein